MQYLLKYNGYQSACCKLFENNSTASFKIAFIFVFANKYYLVFALFFAFFLLFYFRQLQLRNQGESCGEIMLQKRAVCCHRNIAMTVYEHKKKFFPLGQGRNTGFFPANCFQLCLCLNNIEAVLRDFMASLRFPAEAQQIVRSGETILNGRYFLYSKIIVCCAVFFIDFSGKQVCYNVQLKKG